MYVRTNRVFPKGKSSKLGHDPKNKVLFVANSKRCLTRNINVIVILPFRNINHQISDVNYLDPNQIEIILA